MVLTLSRSRSNRFVIVFMLTFAMVFAHWQGLSHRIAHASQYPVPSAGLIAKAPSGSHQQALQHSCLAYDAATVAAALRTPSCTTGVLPGGPVLAHWAAFDSWNAPFTGYFSARGPPFA